jgi:putative oxidoreductase
MKNTRSNFLARALAVHAAPTQTDIGLLIVRVMAGFSLFLRHGIEKATGFSQMAAHFPDPLHIGSTPSLAFALLSDAICSLLIIVGLGTRFAAAVIAVNLTVAFTLVHRMAFSGPRGGELPWVYLAIALMLFFTGPGRFSLDYAIGRPRRF